MWFFTGWGSFVNLQRWLQISTAMLAVLGASFLVLTGDQTWFPYALGISAVVALLVTDWYGWVKIPRGLGNLAALVSVAWTFREFMRLSRDREAQLLTISHMLIYLQVVLVFQAKSRRVHWQLLVLSVLQVVVAAALAMGPQFGMLLTIYMATAIASMLLLCYQRDVFDDEAPLPAVGKSPVSLHRLLDPPRLRTSDARQQQLEHWVRTPWLAQCVLMFTLGSMAFTLVFFFSSPRLSEAMWQSGRSRSAVSGFSGEVVLPTSGTIQLSDQPVMRVSFLNATTGRSMQLTSEPYFHGQVLTNYHHNEYGARWSFRPADGLGYDSSFHAVEAASPSELVKQDIALDATQSKLLFAMFPVVPLPETPDWVKEKRRYPRLLREGHDEQLNLMRELRYRLGTLAIRNGRQLPAVPHYNPGKSLDDDTEFHKELRHHREFAAEQFPEIKRVADEVIRSQRLENESTLVRAQALRNHLYDSGEFQYSLQIEPPPEEGSLEESPVDPLERFVAVGRKGHCEYFASALVMMLRSQAIPARMVVGYKGGDWNALGQYYLVRQKHAHAWVEVLLLSSETPADEIAGKPNGSGNWYRLDPTPPSIDLLAGSETASSRMAEIIDYADHLWRDYVLGLNSGRQDSVMEPLRSRSRELLPASFNATGWQRWLQQSLQKNPNSTAPTVHAAAATPWLSYLLLLGLAVATPAILAGALLLARWLWQRACARQQVVSHSAPEFFRELHRILERQGIPLSPQATASELVQVAAQRLTLPSQPNSTNQPATTRDLSAVLEMIVAGYHRVRFGGDSLNPHEQAAIATALALLQRAQLQRAQARPSSSAVN